MINYLSFQSQSNGTECQVTDYRATSSVALGRRPIRSTRNTERSHKLMPNHIAAHRNLALGGFDAQRAGFAGEMNFSPKES